MNLIARIEHEGPKKLLAIDGGGVRGVLALEVLQRIEDLLKAKSGRVDFRLADYFDYIAGTSTGGIIAAGLSIGMSVGEILAFYQEAGDRARSSTPTPTTVMLGRAAVRFAIAKAEAANDSSNSALALSTSNLYAPSQPGESLEKPSEAGCALTDKIRRMEPTESTVWAQIAAVRHGSFSLIFTTNYKLTVPEGTLCERHR
jgi:hypothetical protein